MSYQEADEISLMDIVKVIKRRAKLCTVFIAVWAVIAAVFAFSRQPKYQFQQLVSLSHYLEGQNREGQTETLLQSAGQAIYTLNTLVKPQLYPPLQPQPGFIETLKAAVAKNSDASGATDLVTLTTTATKAQTAAVTAVFKTMLTKLQQLQAVQLNQTKAFFNQDIAMSQYQSDRFQALMQAVSPSRAVLSAVSLPDLKSGQKTVGLSSRDHLLALATRFLHNQREQLHNQQAQLNINATQALMLAQHNMMNVQHKLQTLVPSQFVGSPVIEKATGLVGLTLFVLCLLLGFVVLGVLIVLLEVKTTISETE